MMMLCSRALFHHCAIFFTYTLPGSSVWMVANAALVIRFAPTKLTFGNSGWTAGLLQMSPNMRELRSLYCSV